MIIIITSVSVIMIIIITTVSVIITIIIITNVSMIYTSFNGELTKISSGSDREVFRECKQMASCQRA